MIHGGLQINLKKDHNKVFVNQCCLRPDMIEVTDDLWNNQQFTKLREKNNQNIWDSACWTCQANEKVNTPSLRTGTLEQFGVQTNLSGPVRLDLMFDIGCNLACRTCGPQLSTYWQRHLKEHKIAFTAPRPVSRVDDMIDLLRTLDLSNLGLVVFCGGETLLGNSYWQVAEELARLVPNAKEKLTVSFQTNGTQTIDKEYYSIIEKFHLVKLHISLDGIKERFNYLRWPADWNQVTNNVLQSNQNLPVNVMFLIEETVSIFNLYYQQELATWIEQNFKINRLGDAVNHTRHMAEGIFGIHNLSNEYIRSIDSNFKKMLRPEFNESSRGIKKMLEEIHKFDTLRNQDWTKVFPEVAEFYSKFAISGKYI
jgi:sulfatase maturation enzyme AslB (radical SAM superfamily)